jgi:hypothetical protein
MKLALVLLAALALVPLAAPHVDANPLPIYASECTPSHWPFINPGIDRQCVIVDFGNINDFCLVVGPASKCVHFIGPDAPALP